MQWSAYHFIIILPTRESGAGSRCLVRQNVELPTRKNAKQNRKIQDSKYFYWQIMKQELNKMTKVKKGLEMKYRDIPKNQYINTKLQ